MLSSYPQGYPPFLGTTLSHRATDPLVDLGHLQVRLSSIRHDQVTRSRFLGPLYRTGAPARCMCTEPSVEMGIARRGDRAPVYYLYHLHRHDQELHTPECPHRVEHVPLIAAQEEAEAPAQEPADSTSLVVHVPLLQPQPIKPKSRTFSLAGMDALLDALLVSAGLNVWRPYFAGHRSYFQARFRLIEAAKKIRTYGSSTLADLLYFPPVWDPSKVQDIEFDLSEFMARLAPTEENMLPRGVIVGRVKDVEQRPTWTAPRIRLSESRLHFWMDAWPELIGPPCPDYFYFVMLAVERPPDSDRLRVLDAAVSLMTPSWIPVATPDHAALANTLVGQRASFTSSMRSDETTCFAYPDLLAYAPGAAARVIPLPHSASGVPAPTGPKHDRRQKIYEAQ